MDNLSKALLAIIAIALCSIAYKLYFPGKSILNATTWGEFMSLQDIQDQKLRSEMQLEMMKRVPIVRIQGGNVSCN